MWRGRAALSPNKPTGQIGPFRITGGPNRPVGDWSKIQFSTKKEEIEQFILNLFLAEMRKNDASIIAAKKNPENDFDFTLELPGGRVSLDLTEIIYRDAEGRPYAGDNIRIQSYTYAEQIRDAVMAKSAHYAGISGQPIHLLTYITHWRFHAHEVVIRLVQHMLQQSRPIMENVFFLSPLDETAATLRVLYPSANPLGGYELDRLKDDWYLTLNPANWELVTEKLQLPEKTMPRANPPAQIDDVQRVSHCWVEDDGRHVVIEIELSDGRTFGLRLPYDQLDFTAQALLQNTFAAYQRQVERGTVTDQQNFLANPMMVESSRIMRVQDGSHLLIQCYGRATLKEPLGMGSLLVDESHARDLGKQLLESADLMAQSRRSSQPR
jgi:hypothetical protein